MYKYPQPLEIALEEEIGNPDLFVGRKQDLGFFLEWVEQVRRKLG